MVTRQLGSVIQNPTSAELQFGQSPGSEVRQTPTSARRLVAEDEFVKELVLVALEALRQRIC